MADFFTGDLSQDPGWGWGPVDNPDRASFTEGFIDPSSPFDTSTSSGSGWGDASKWAAGLKDLAGGLKGAGLPSPGTPARNDQRIVPNMHQGTAGSLGTLLQLLSQRALAFNQAAHQGAVPARVQGGQGLLGV